MKPIQRIISGILVFCLVLPMLPTNGWAEEITAIEQGTNSPMGSAVDIPEKKTGLMEASGEENSGECGETAFWSFDESTGTLIIYGSGDMYCYNTLEEYPWNTYWKQIKTVTVESGVSNIGDHAFDGYPNLTSVIMPESVIAIGDFAFYGCVKLAEVSSLESVKTIGAYAFDECYALTDIKISKEIATIGEYAFYDCESLADITFCGKAPDSVGENAFYGVDATANYPSDNATWTETVMLDYGGSIKWVPYGQHEHSYTEFYLLPTCTEQGYVAYFCECGYSYKDGFEDALGHDMGVWEIFMEPTCVADGEKRSYCSRCEYYETIVIPSVEPVYVQKVIMPTCTEQGYTTYTCSACGESYIDDFVDALGHDMGDWQIIKETSCDETGEKRSDCSRCDFFETKVIPVPGHTYTAVVTEPTCLDKGFTTYTCDCGDSYTDAYVEALGHDMEDWVIVKDAVCENAGEKRSDCSRCEYYEIEPIPAPGHAFSSVDTVPTCTEPGYTSYSCKCGKSYIDDEIDALGHAYDEGIITTEPGCETEGIKTFTCTNDPTHVYVEAIPATEHSFSEWYIIKDATTETEGEERRDCKKCNHHENRVICKPTPEDNPSSSIIASGSWEGDLTWKITQDGTLTVSGTGEMKDDLGDGYEIPWYSLKDRIYKVVINEGITHIGDRNFYRHSNLVSVDLPDSVTSIGPQAFMDCSSLTAVEIPRYVTSIAYGTFLSCLNLKDVTIPCGVTQIGSGAFAWCSSLTKVVLPKGVRKVEGGAFSYCSGLSVIALPNSLIEVGAEAFSKCSSLTDVYYAGTIEQWKEVKISTLWNQPLINARLHTNYCPDEMENWQKAYYDFIVTDKSTSSFDWDHVTYELVYLNDDNIPELWIDYSFAVSGSRIMSYYNDQLVTEGLTGGTLTYEEKNNAFYNSWGHAGQFTDKVYHLTDEGLVEDAIGTYHMYDQNGNMVDYVTTWNWAGLDVPEEWYYKYLHEWVDTEVSITTGIRNDTIYDYNGILNYLLAVRPEEPDKAESGLVISSDYTNLSISIGSTLTLSAGILVDGKRISDTSGITFQVEDASILGISGSGTSYDSRFIKLKGLKEGNTTVVISDSATGYKAKVSISVYKLHSAALSGQWCGAEWPPCAAVAGVFNR